MKYPSTSAHARPKIFPLTPAADGEGDGSSRRGERTESSSFTTLEGVPKKVKETWRIVPFTKELSLNDNPQMPVINKPRPNIDK